MKREIYKREGYEFMSAAFEVYNDRRSGLSEEQIESRIRSQMPAEEKVKYADFVVDNSGSIESTRAQVKRVYEQLRAAVRINRFSRRNRKRV